MNNSVANLNTSKRQQGMTLLEVMLALVIFSVAALSILNATTQHINNLDYLKDKTFANWVADNQLTRLSIEKKLNTNTQGNEQLGGVTWHWQTKLVETQLSYVQAVDIQVSKNEDLSHPIVSLRTYVKPN